MPVPLGWPVDVVLEPGELVHTIVGGDRAPLAEGEPPRWEVKEGQSETQYTPVQHIFFVATHVGQKMGVIVATSRRTYYLTLKCVAKTDVRAIRWRYPAPPVPPVVVKRRPASCLIRSSPTGCMWAIWSWRRTRCQSGRRSRSWMTGKKCTFSSRPTTRFAVAPMVRGNGPNGPFIVSARHMDTVMILDQMIGVLELRYGEGETAQVVTVQRGPLTMIVCPGDAQCPPWPDEWPRQARKEHAMTQAAPWQARAILPGRHALPAWALDSAGVGTGRPRGREPVVSAQSPRRARAGGRKTRGTGRAG